MQSVEVEMLGQLGDNANGTVFGLASSWIAMEQTARAVGFLTGSSPMLWRSR